MLHQLRSVATIILSTGLPGLFLFSLPACSDQGPETGETFSAIKQRNELIVLTRNAPTTYYETRDNQYAGFEYTMAMDYANTLNVKTRFVVKDTVDEILSALQAGKGDLAAAGLTKTDERKKQFIFGPGYQTVKQQLVCRRNNGGIPRSIDKLGDRKLVVTAETSYVERLQALKQKHPDLKWQVDHERDTELLLQQVWLRKIDCTVADSNILQINQRYYPELKVAFSLDQGRPLAWMLPAHAKDLQQSIEYWFKDYKNSGQLKDAINRYYGHLEKFDYVDTRRFRNRIQSRLPKYKKWFRQAAAKYKLDWQLLAAQSYQESHWNPKAKSPTGVRGIMMLTRPTAKQMGVKDRLDARANIFGGAKYLARMRNRIPDHITEPERTWMALAAYNIGFGHLRDARKLTSKLGRDPDRWVDLEATLPLLTQKQHYKSLAHGYARGHEAVDYVRRIRDYRDILARYESGRANAPANDPASGPGRFLATATDVRN